MGRLAAGIAVVLGIGLIGGCQKPVLKHAEGKPATESTEIYEQKIEEQHPWNDGAPQTGINLNGAQAIITLNYRVDPFEQDGLMAWSPDGKTLAYIDGKFLVTYHLNRHLRLPEIKSEDSNEFMPWTTIRWRPDGKQLIVDGLSATLVIDLEQWKIIKKVDYPQMLWWFANSLATSQQVDPPDPPKEATRTWTANGVTHRFPPGFQPYHASREGRAILGNVDNSDELWLLNVDPQSGEIKEKRTFLTPGRTDYVGGLALDWNDKIKLAAHLVDTSGGSSNYSFVSGDSWETGLELWSARGCNFSDSPRWIDDRWLCVKLVTYERWQTHDKISCETDISRIALYDAVTGRLRTIYHNTDLLAIAPTQDQVAMLMQVDGEWRIVITDWVKSKTGEIIAVKYGFNEQVTKQYLRTGVLLKKVPAKPLRGRAVGK